MHRLTPGPRPVPAPRIWRATLSDCAAIARLYRRTAGAEWAFLVPHTPEEDLAFFQDAFAAGPVWAAEVEAEVETGLVGFIALRRGWVDHLFVAPSWQGRGIGRALLRQGLRRRRRVRLWTFQRNARARAFYRRQGFAELRLTDGAANEERQPDVLLEWRRG